MAHNIVWADFATTVRTAVMGAVSDVKQRYNITPGLAVVLVGNDPASQVYVNSKAKHTRACGMESFEFRLPDTAHQDDIIALVQDLNTRADIHGILVQLPLPAHMDAEAIINTIAVEKDVDGFHVLNAGALATGTGRPMLPCTPYGCMVMIQDILGHDLSGKHAVVVGRSNIVGKPMAHLLLNAHATVTIVHSRTKHIESLTAQADIVVAAVGRPQMIKSDWIKSGAVVMDVGINRISDSDGTQKLVGDVDYDSVKTVAHAVSPVPGGVGPMTIAMLLLNTVIATCTSRDIKLPDAIAKYIIV